MCLFVAISYWPQKGARGAKGLNGWDVLAENEFFDLKFLGAKIDQEAVLDLGRTQVAKDLCRVLVCKEFGCLDFNNEAIFNE